jgi:Lrp/AsnC family transcriptional regulator for asnA, asnC and gidA
VRYRTTKTTVVEMDAVDQAIITALQEDGRRPYGRIAETVGLSEYAVRQRTGRLIDEGIIRIAAITDPDLLGLKLRATLCLRITGDIAPALAALDALDEADYVVTTAGHYDVLAEVQCVDEMHLDTLINQTLRTVPGIAAIETLVYLRFHKRTYAWPSGSVPAGPAE